MSTAAHQLDARALLAEIYSSAGEFAKAAEQLRWIAGARPNEAATWRRLGDALFAAGEPAAAADGFRQAIVLDPKNARAHNNLGRALAGLREREAAVTSYRQALALDPKYAIAHLNLGIALGESGQLEEALSCHDQAIALNPRFAEAYSNQGNVRLRLNRPEEALASLERALALEPQNAAIHCNCGNVLLRLGRFEAALQCFDRALHLKPEFPEALNNRGNALRELRRLDAALVAYERAITLQPGNLEALCNKANALLELERFEDTIACCDGILLLRPECPQALLYRGMALKILFRYDEAADCFARLLEAEPTQHYTLGYLLYADRLACDWSRTALTGTALKEIAAGKPAVSPLISLALTDSAEAQLQCARVFVKHTHPPARDRVWSGQHWDNKRIRVAYLSGDLRAHALSYLMVGVFEKHDRERFETFAVSFRKPVNNPFGLRVMQAFDTFLDVEGQTDLQAAQFLRDTQIDIAVDLMGFTRGQRISIFAHRPAPVQVTYLGHPGTTGTPYIDYLIADEFTIPAHKREHYSERVVCMPDCFQANDDRRIIAAERPTRAQSGLPQDAFVFCSFNTCYKITPDMFDIWCRILQARPDSVLWMFADTPAAQTNLCRAATARGVDPQRLVFAGRLPYEEHLARLQLADLFLDTLPFNAGATASDALWGGVPVLTCTGDAFAARMAGSLLRALGLPELVTENLHDYERLALRLSAPDSELRRLRTRLAENRTRYPLFDTERFCRNLESAYVTMHERARRGEPPVSFAVAPPVAMGSHAGAEGALASEGAAIYA